MDQLKRIERLELYSRNNTERTLDSPRQSGRGLDRIDRWVTNRTTVSTTLRGLPAAVPRSFSAWRRRERPARPVGAASVSGPTLWAVRPNGRRPTCTWNRRWPRSGRPSAAPGTSASAGPARSGPPRPTDRPPTIPAAPPDRCNAGVFHQVWFFFVSETRFSETTLHSPPYPTWCFFLWLKKADWKRIAFQALWFAEINWEIWNHGRYRSMKFPYANMMLNQGDFDGREVMRVGSVF